MAIAAIDIANLALSEIGARATIAALTEDSREAEICNLWYDQSFEQVLAMAPWPAATASELLEVLAERPNADWVDGDPLPGYRFTYKLPDDCLRPRYLTTFATFEIGSTELNEAALYTNSEKAILVYTKQVTSPNLWDPALRMAIVYTLAAHIAMPLMGKPDRAKMLEEKAFRLVTEARVNAANMNQTFFESMPEWITARGYGGAAATDRFIYPSATILISGGAESVS